MKRRRMWRTKLSWIIWCMTSRKDSFRDGCLTAASRWDMFTTSVCCVMRHVDFVTLILDIHHRPSTDNESDSVRYTSLNYQLDHSHSESSQLWQFVTEPCLAPLSRFSKPCTDTRHRSIIEMNYSTTFIWYFQPGHQNNLGNTQAKSSYLGVPPKHVCQLVRPSVCLSMKIDRICIE